MGKTSEEFQRFDSLMEQVLAVPKATISERIAAMGIGYKACADDLVAVICGAQGGT